MKDRDRKRDNWIERDLGREFYKRKIQANASQFTKENMVTSWVFIKGLAPILVVVHFLNMNMLYMAISIFNIC